MEQVYATAAFTLWGILLFVFVIGIIINKKKLKDTPQDDSNWNTDYDELKNALRKFVSNKNEEVVAILGKVSAIKLLNSNINNVGFCILSDSHQRLQMGTSVQPVRILQRALHRVQF